MSNRPLHLMPRGVPAGLYLLRVMRTAMASVAWTSEHAESVMLRLSVLAARLVDGRVLRAHSGGARHEALMEAVYRVSLGLERAFGPAMDRAAESLTEAGIQVAFDEGGAVLTSAARRAQTVGDFLILRSGLPTALCVLQELPLCNAVERTFIEALTHGKMALESPAARLVRWAEPRRIASMADVRSAAEMLRLLEVRGALFRAFPPERLFAHDYPPDRLGDTARVAVSRVLVNVALGRDDPPRFALTGADAAACAALLDDPSVRARLADWTERFVSTHLPAAEHTAARVYLDDCAATLPEVLPLLV
jgi:hypothetical protein